MREQLLVLLSSVALAVRVPSAIRPSTARCVSPIALAREPPLAYEVTRDPQPAVVDRSVPPAIKESVPFAEYLSAKRTGRQPATSPPPTILVQGGSLRTWSYRNPALERVQVVLSSEGRPVDAEIELWKGPGNIPCKMKVYVEDGHLLPFAAVIQTPNTVPSLRPSFGDNVNAKPGAVPSTIAIRNIGELEFPFAANVFTDGVDRPSPECISAAPRVVQGGALCTYPFDPYVGSVQVLLRTDGRPLNARIEILQGPNNNKQIVELYTEDGRNRPFFAVFETPGHGSVVRVVNTASMEYPLSATVVPDSIDDFGGDGLDGADGLNVVGDAPRVGRYDTVY